MSDYDIPGVIRFVRFVGGSLDGLTRPIPLHGRAVIEDGSRYNRLVPTEQTWVYSAKRDQYELSE